MALLPISEVTLKEPTRTMSIMVLNALVDKRSVGATKLPAALLMTMDGRPNAFSHLSTAAATSSCLPTLAAIGST